MRNPLTQFVEQIIPEVIPIVHVLKKLVWQNWKKQKRYCEKIKFHLDKPGVKLQTSFVFMDILWSLQN
jgi:hypothetical protein